MSSIDPSAREIGDLKIVSKVKSMFEVKPDDDVQEVVRGKKSKPEPEPVAAPVAVVATNGLVDGAEEKNEEVKETVVEEKPAPVVEEKKPEPAPVIEVEEKAQPVGTTEEKPVPEETGEEKHVTFNEEKPAVINDEKPESESKEAAKNDTKISEVTDAV